MPRAAYAPLPSAHEAAEAAERQMEDAFDVSDDEDDDGGQSQETRPMIPVAQAGLSSGNSPSSNNNLYNFEYDYTMPPPGSPPRPSARAIPDNVFGNSNGYVPVSAHIPRSSASRSGWIQAILVPFLPRRLFSNASQQHRVIGGGSNNDGVFANVVAKPTVGTENNLRSAEEGSSNAHVVPEFEQKDAPPTYADAQQDAVPSYWDTTVLAPANMGDEFIIEGLAPGHILVFVTSFFVSFSFQFIGMSSTCPHRTRSYIFLIGFMLTSIIASTHAGRFGSRAGLGITLVQYGFYLRSSLRDTQMAQPDVNGWAPAAEPHPTFTSPQEANDYYATRISPVPTGAFPEIPSLSNGDYALPSEVTAATDWLSFFLMTVGWLIFLTSLLGFYRVKRWERSLQQSAVHNSVMGGSEFERPMFRTLREGPLRDMGRIFARLPSGVEQFRNTENHSSEPQHTPPPPSPPPMDAETRQRYEAAMVIDRRYVSFSTDDHPEADIFSQHRE